MPADGGADTLAVLTDTGEAPAVAVSGAAWADIVIGVAAPVTGSPARVSEALAGTAIVGEASAVINMGVDFLVGDRRVLCTGTSADKAFAAVVPVVGRTVHAEERSGRDRHAEIFTSLRNTAAVLTFDQDRWEWAVTD
jgi:hypothetical protein